MAQPYVGEIRIFAGNFPPNGWMFCDGALVPINQNETLFQLIGTTYGGDGQNTFALPDLRGRVPTHQGSSGGTTYTLAESGGVEAVTLTTQQMPAHTHPMVASSVQAQNPQPQGSVPAQTITIQPYISDTGQVPLNAAAVGPVGGSQPHSNFQPYLGVNFIISMFGIFPSPT